MFNVKNVDFGVKNGAILSFDLTRVTSFKLNAIIKQLLP